MADSTILKFHPISNHMNQNKISPKRHIAKTITYRIISTLVGFLTMWSVTGSIKVGTTFGLFELVYKPIQYFIHERVWYKWIKFGVSEEPKVVKVEEPKETIKRLNYTRR